MASKPQQQRVNQTQQKREFLFKIAACASQLLKAVGDARQQKQEMSWAENQLFQGNLLSYDPSRESPAIWADQAIARNPDLMDQSVPYLLEYDSHPEEESTFEGLISRLIPSEGGL